MNYVRSNSLSLKYQGFPLSDCQDIGIKEFEFVAKTQFLCTDKLASYRAGFTLVLRYIAHWTVDTLFFAETHFPVLIKTLIY